MKNWILRQLTEAQLISEPQATEIRTRENRKLFSLHWELKTLLYAGILLLNAGLGWLVYQNIDSIGHQAILVVIAAACALSAGYANRYRLPFSYERSESPSPFAGYMLLLACFTFLILEGYVQYQYTLFGTRYGLATFIPALLFLMAAYLFDHQGVLAMGIALLASWLGIAVTPRELFVQYDFSGARLIYTGILLGAILVSAGFASDFRNLKRHFSITYLNFGMHILFLASISGMMTLKPLLAFTTLLAVVTALFIRYSRREKSFYFLIVSVMYAYWGLSYLVFQLDIFRNDLIFFYFILSCAGVLYFLARYRKILNASE
jgi:hypothetical protein